MGLRRKLSGQAFVLISGLYYGKKRTPPLTMALFPKHFFARFETSLA
jgi:hypothetical protein